MGRNYFTNIYIQDVKYTNFKTQTIRFINYSHSMESKNSRHEILYSQVAKDLHCLIILENLAWSATNGCADVVATYEDQTFNVVEKVCLKILKMDYYRLV